MSSSAEKYSSATRTTLFCCRSILLTIYAYKGGGEPIDDMMTRGREGSGYPPKVMDGVSGVDTP